MNRWIEIVAGVTLITGLTFSAPAQHPAPPPPVNPEFIALPNTAARALPIEHKNITYLRASGQDLQLDVYQQPGTNPPPSSSTSTAEPGGRTPARRALHPSNHCCRKATSAANLVQPRFAPDFPRYRCAGALQISAY